MFLNGAAWDEICLFGWRRLHQDFLTLMAKKSKLKILSVIVSSTGIRHGELLLHTTVTAQSLG